MGTRGRQKKEREETGYAPRAYIHISKYLSGNHYLLILLLLL